MNKTSDPHAQGVLEARLGRPPRDVIEAAVVLEAWAGRTAPSAMSAAQQLVVADDSPESGVGRVDAGDGEQQQSVIMEGVALVLSILSIAACAKPLSAAFGARTLADAIRVALPITIAMQWALRSRYLSLRGGLALLARDGKACAALTIMVVALPLALAPRWGLITAMLVAIWVGGAVMTRRGWGLLYALALVAAAVLLAHRVSASVILLSLTGFTASLCLAAVWSGRQPTDERPGPVSRAGLAAVLGGCIGVLLVADPSLGWGVHGVHPAIALVPSVIGSL
jgi:hypothetical protein